MFIIYECAACLLAALIGGTLLFTAGVMCVMLMEAGGMAWRRWPRTDTARHVAGGKVDG